MTLWTDTIDGWWWWWKIICIFLASQSTMEFVNQICMNDTWLSCLTQKIIMTQTLLYNLYEFQNYNRATQHSCSRQLLGQSIGSQRSLTCLWHSTQQRLEMSKWWATSSFNFQLSQKRVTCHSDMSQTHATAVQHHKYKFWLIFGL